MRYIEYQLTDLGYHVEALGGPGEIFGLDNRVMDDDGFEDDQRFWHQGVTGYPDGARCCLDSHSEPESKTLAIFEDGCAIPLGGAEVAAAEVAALLVAEYGWSVGTTLGADGMPMRPCAEVAA